MASATVVSTGPYRIARHPGYTGALLVVRTALEDKTLLKELPGYEEYTRVTRWRLVPGVW